MDRHCIHDLVDIDIADLIAGTIEAIVFIAEIRFECLCREIPVFNCKVDCVHTFPTIGAVMNERPRPICTRALLYLSPVKVKQVKEFDQADLGEPASPLVRKDRENPEQATEEFRFLGHRRMG